MKNGICPKCESHDVIPKIRVIDRYDPGTSKDLSVQTYEKPDALLFKGRHNYTLHAWVCGNCRYTELYVDNPKELSRVYRRFHAK